MAILWIVGGGERAGIDSQASVEFQREDQQRVFKEVYGLLKPTYFSMFKME